MLDGYDRKILAHWQQQGDMGPVEMARAVHLSPSQCSRRMAQLRRDGLVPAIHARLAPAPLGIGLSAYVLLVMSSHEPAAAQRFHDRILALDEVLECQRLTGEADIILKVATRDLQSFNALLTTHILGAPEVATARSSIILEDLKSTTHLPLRFAAG